MKRLLLALGAILLLTVGAFAQDLVRPGQYYTTLPTLVNNQWAALATDSSSRQIIAPVCESSAVINVAAAATGELVAISGTTSIYVCSFVLTGDTAATTAVFKYGTGVTCGTDTVNLTGAMRMVDEGNIVISGAVGPLFKTIAAQALCLTAATGAVTGFVSYGQR